MSSEAPTMSLGACFTQFFSTLAGCFTKDIVTTLLVILVNIGGMLIITFAFKFWWLAIIGFIVLVLLNLFTWQWIASRCAGDFTSSIPELFKRTISGNFVMLILQCILCYLFIVCTFTLGSPIAYIAFFAFVDGDDLQTAWGKAFRIGFVNWLLSLLLLAAGFLCGLYIISNFTCAVMAGCIYHVIAGKAGNVDPAVAATIGSIGAKIGSATAGTAAPAPAPAPETTAV